MPPLAIRCSTCQTFTDWRGYIPRSEVVLALIVSIISLLAAVVPPVINWWNDRSFTQVRVLGVERMTLQSGGRTVDNHPTIVAAIHNTGKRPAFIRGAMISLKPLDLGEHVLYIAEPTGKYLKPGDPTIVHFFATTVPKSKLSDLVSKKITVILHVEETTRFGGRDTETREDGVDALELQEWLFHATQ